MIITGIKEDELGKVYSEIRDAMESVSGHTFNFTFEKADFRPILLVVLQSQIKKINAMSGIDEEKREQEIQKIEAEINNTIKEIEHEKALRKAKELREAEERAERDRLRELERNDPRLSKTWQLRRKLRDVEVEGIDLTQAGTEVLRNRWWVNFEELIYYLSWRTKFRKGEWIDPPREYLQVYLYEVEHFIECDSIKEVFGILLKIKSFTETNERLIWDVTNTLKYFSYYYGTAEDLKNYYIPLMRIPDTSLLKKDYSNSLSIISVAAHKIRKNTCYSVHEYAALVEEKFPVFLENLVEFYNTHGIDIIRFIYGTLEMMQRYETLDRGEGPVRDLIVEKEVYSDSGDLLVRVTREAGWVQVLKEHPVRIPLRDFILKSFDNMVREKVGIRPKLRPNLEKIEAKIDRTEEKKIVALLKSDGFKELLKCSVYM